MSITACKSVNINRPNRPLQPLEPPVRSWDWSCSCRSVMGWSSISTPPMEITSPSPMARMSTRSPLTQVPVLELASVMVQLPSS